MFKLLGTIKVDFLRPLVLKMSLGQIGIVRREFEDHKQELQFKDDENQVQSVSNSAIYYFIYLDEEKKTGANASNLSTTQTVQNSRSDFDDFLTKKEEAKDCWLKNHTSDAKNIWFEIYKQIKSSISKKALEALPEDKRAQFHEIKTSCITNVLKALFKLSELDEAASVFLEFSPENDTSIKYLDIGFEILLACKKSDLFEEEVKRIEQRYQQKNPQFLDEFRVKIVDIYRAKFERLRHKENLVIQKNL